MASHTPSARRGSKNVTAEKRAAVITLRFTQELSFLEISTKTGVETSRCGKIFRGALKKCNTKQPSLIQLLEAVQASYKRRGPRVKVAEGSSLSKRLRHDIIEYGEWEPINAVSNILKEYNVTLCPRTLNKIMVYHRDKEHNYAIVRGVQTKKPACNNKAQHLR